ncbi:hypothetical protein ACTWP4_17440 [Gracilibacillus sp. D59]|uniref:hypothetical protein n=1 Tax=Gracilibacillus sp. D59 TaxID=3457434 RepID=UPI003FCC5DEE
MYEATFDLNLPDLELPINPVTEEQIECDDIDLDTVTYDVAPAEPDPIVVLDREDQVFMVDEEEVTLQIVYIRKNLEVTVFVNLVPELGGNQVEVGTAVFTRCAQVILCAPEGTGRCNV